MYKGHHSNHIDWGLEHANCFFACLTRVQHVEGEWLMRGRGRENDWSQGVTAAGRLRAGWLASGWAQHRRAPAPPERHTTPQAGL